jgi:hypothetical protein
MDPPDGDLRREVYCRQADRNRRSLPAGGAEHGYGQSASWGRATDLAVVPAVATAPKVLMLRGGSRA